MRISRRNLTKSAALGAILAGLPAGVRLSLAATGSNTNVIIFLLLRGGMDGLNLVGPADDADLIAARPATLRLVASGTGAGLPLAHGPSNNDWRLHPSAPQLKALYDAGHLAFVHASGLPADSRSHFEMQALLEHGVTDPALLTQTSGWIGRYATGIGISATFGVVSSADTLPPSMNGDGLALSLPNPSQFTLGSAARSALLQATYGQAGGMIGAQGRTAIGAVQALGRLTLQPAPAGTYGSDAVGEGLSVIAQLIKAQAGLQMAEVEYTAWDTHVNQAPQFATMVSNLSRGLGAFYNDIAAFANNVTVVVMSEFGRRVQSNADGGTDHGHGNAMMVLGGRVRGGRIYGSWPGLGAAVLDQGDLPITTDCRAVLSEAVAATRQDLPAGLFPGLASASPLGLFS